MKLSFLKIINTNDPVEIYLFKQKLYPKKIIGNGSTAMVTLKKINHNLNFANFFIKPKTKDPFYLKEIKKSKMINKYLSKLGVKTILFKT